MALAADVIVIGGGPAGSAAARLLAAWDRSVIVLARAPARPLARSTAHSTAHSTARSTARRALGESLPPSCGKLLDTIGVRGAVDAADFVRATGNTVLWGGGARRIEQFSDSARGWQVARDRFDALLLDAAQAAGALIVRGATARSAIRADDAWHVAYDADAGRSTCRAPWVLDCSGRAGLVARSGWRRPEPAERTTALVAIFQSDRWRGAAYATHTLVESYGGGWAWSVPLSLTRRCVTVMVDPRHSDLPTRPALEHAYRDELARTEMLSELVEHATLIDAPWGCDASPYSCTRAGDDGALLVGDAASFVDPLSSFGVKKALASAWLGAVVANTALGNAALATPAVDLFCTRERTMYDELQRRASELARDAAAAHAGTFWSARSDGAGDVGGDVSDAAPGELDAALLRGDARVREAFEELKRRDAMVLRAGDALRIVQQAVVRGNRIVLEDHLALPAIPGAARYGARYGARYCRNVDLVTIARLAPQFDQVPDLFAAYNRAAPPAPLPDFLGALSALIGLGFLSFA